MNPVNGFTPEGLPTLYLWNMPVQSTVPGLSVTRPEVYYGELTNTDVYVKTHQQEFNYPNGQSNNLTTYQGTGGIPMGGFLRRVLLAYSRGDIGKVPFSDDIDANSRLLMRRNVIKRVSTIAPFLPTIPILTSWSATTAVSSGSSMASPPPTRTRTPRMPRWATAKSTTCATA